MSSRAILNGWPLGSGNPFPVGLQPITLNALIVGVNNAVVGTPISSTISGLTSGSSISLTGAGSAGLSISGAVITGTPTTAGLVNIVETLPGATNSPRLTPGVITVTVSAPVPTPGNTYANTTQVYANNSSFSPDLVNVEQRLLALGGSYSQYRVNYGTGANTATGDTVSAALVKLQNWIAAIEITRAATQDNTLAGNTTLLAGNAAWKTRFQALETRFTALGVA